MQNYYLGLDIGVASVGWAVVGEDYSVIETGSNLFPCADASKNEERRSFRQARRLKRRQKTRINDFKKMWKQAGFDLPNQLDNDILSLRIKGIKDMLSDKEIYAVLLYMLKHRGISYLEDALDEGQSSKSEYGRGLLHNQKELETKLPCEIQFEKYKEYGSFRGDIKVEKEDGDKETYSNVFTTSSYRKELKRFFDTQKSFNSKIDDKFEDDYMSIFKRKREYYTGPGNNKSRTDYGVYTTQKDENGKYITEDNLFAKLIGKCSVYPEELRAAGASYTAQEFNALNDLNNLTINARKLEQQEKEKIIETIKSSKVVNMKNIIKKVTGEDINSLKGARINKQEKEIFHTFETYRKMKKALLEVDIDIDSFSREELDKVAEIITINTEKEGIIKGFESSEYQFDEAFIDVMANLRKNNSSLFNKWQSLSLKIMNELIPVMYETSKEQMTLLTDMGVFKKKNSKYEQYKYIPVELVAEDIYNPVVKRSVRVAIKIVNAIIKKYGYPSDVVIEMPRDKNDEERKKRIQNTQKNNEKELSDIKAKIESEYGIVIEDADFRKHKKLALKLKLWNEQNGKCPYSGKTIGIDEILSNEGMFEIDHIIPLSVSYDDSRNNKVLVYRTENQDKGVQTPYMYLSGLNRDWNFDEFMSYVLELRKLGNIRQAKVNNFLFREDITKTDVLKGFINRNINDTAYASRTILNTLQSYFKTKECDTKVKVVRGSFTHQMRVNLRLGKNRDESYSHHAVDAMLICYSQMGYKAYRKFQDELFDIENDKTIEKSVFNQLTTKSYENNVLNDDYNLRWKNIRDNIEDAEKRVKYWHRVDKKVNRGLCNQTIYGTRNVDGDVIKISKLNIYSNDGYKAFVNKINKGKEKDFLMYHNDPKTFEIMMKIYKEYKDEKNAFVAYEKDTRDYFRKYSKNNNGPKISMLKYYDGKVGSCIDISHKYGFEKGSQKVFLEQLKPYRTDVYYNAEEEKYILVGIKYSDIKVEKERYVLDRIKYNDELIREGVIEEGAILEESKYQYAFSLYKNDIIEYEKAGNKYKERFLSRTMPAQKNYIETKPIDAPKFEKQNLVGLSKTKHISKVMTDILGNEYRINQETFKWEIDM